MDHDTPDPVDLRSYIAEADDIARALAEPWTVAWAGEPSVTCCAIGHVFTLYKAPLSSGRVVYHRRCENCTRVEYVV